MGEAKRRRAEQAGLIYHHTSTLRTNQLWMSGVILPEGKMPPVLHPQIGEIITDATARRPMKDFPGLVWLTRRIEVPNILLNIGFRFVDRATGEDVVPPQSVSADISNALALQRMALGFRIEDVPVVPWPEHAGYSTGEGAELNETAIEAGDDPADWYVAEEPIDLMLMAEVRGSRSIVRPKLERQDGYLADVKRMVAGCRVNPHIFIPPSWLSQEQAQLLARRMGVPAFSAGRPLAEQQGFEPRGA